MNSIGEIYIGRDRTCDIHLSPECKSVSSIHAVIYLDGPTLMYRDRSRNGTYINNVKVHQRAVPIHHGDYIMLAGMYPLSWNAIDRYFPRHQRHEDYSYTNYIQQPQETEERIPDLHKFNWGAFFLYPIWGFFNGCWWAFLVSIVCWWAGIFVSILFGIYGTRLAWQNKRWESADDFEQTQHSWAQWGVALFIIGLVFAFFAYIFFFGMLLRVL